MAVFSRRLVAELDYAGSDLRTRIHHLRNVSAYNFDCDQCDLVLSGRDSGLVSVVAI